MNKVLEGFNSILVEKVEKLVDVIVEEDPTTTKYKLLIDNFDSTMQIFSKLGYMSNPEPVIELNNEQAVAEEEN